MQKRVDKAVATLTIHGAPTMSHRRTLAVIEFLRTQCDLLANEHEELAVVYTAHLYLQPEKPKGVTK